MDIQANWKEIKQYYDKSFRCNLHVVFSSVDKNNDPIATPIGTLFFNRDQTGFYFEKYAVKLARNKSYNTKVCVLAVNNDKFMWVKALFSEKFSTYPGIKLYGILGDKRLATERELDRLSRRMRSTKMLKGNSYLWGDMKYIREIKFIKAEKINLGKMTQHL